MLTRCCLGQIRAFRARFKSRKVTGIRTASLLTEARLDQRQELPVFEWLRENGERTEVAIGRQARIAAEKDDPTEDLRIGQLPVVGETLRVEDRHPHVEQNDLVVF